MGFKMPHIPVIIGVICSGVAAIFQIIGLATAGWLKFLGVFEFGIWEPYGIGSDPDWLVAIRAFAIIGLLLVVASLATGVLQFFSDNAMLLTATKGLTAAASVCILVEFAVFAAKFAGIGYGYGYSFALTVVSFVLCIVSGVCFQLPKCLGLTN